MVLTHLILNDMMKVKGHVAALALRLRDDEPRIAALAALFFHELANKACKARAPCTLHLQPLPRRAGGREATQATDAHAAAQHAGTNSTTAELPEALRCIIARPRGPGSDAPR